MGMVKIFSGMANAACAAVDHMDSDKILGTLAGDDTIFVLCRDNQGAQDVSRLMQSFAEHGSN